MYKLKYGLTIGGQSAIFENRDFWKGCDDETLDKVFERIDEIALIRTNEEVLKNPDVDKYEYAILREDVEQAIKEFQDK